MKQETVKPKGLIEKDDDRLERMRESQRKLRSQRKNELELVKAENAELTKKIEQLTRKNHTLRNDYMSAISVLDDEMTSKQLSKLVTEMDIVPSTLEYIELDEFINNNNYRHYACLFNDDKFILQGICEKNLTCMNKILENYQTFGFKETPLRYAKFYGLELISFHLDSMTLISKGKIPTKWLAKDKLLPKGALSFEEILVYLTKHCTDPVINLTIVASFISRFLFATLHGLSIFEFDLARAIKYGATNNFDEAYLLGTVDETMCIADKNINPFEHLINNCM